MAMPLGPFWLLPLLLSAVCGLTCPLLGTVLVLRRRVQTTNLMAYAVLPGVVISQALDLSPLLGGLLSALGAVLLAESLSATRPEGSGQAEAVLNTVLAASLGLGVLLVQALALPVDLDSLLFGDLLVAGPADLLLLLLALALVVALLCWQLTQLEWLALDPEGAEARESSLGPLRRLLAALTALVVVSATAAVGLALVMALICAPSLAALARGDTSLRRILRRAALVGLVVSTGSCGLALLLNLPPGPLMACACLPLLLVQAREVAVTASEDSL
ncbi:MAG: metal ABC transporter permease [Cyanobacteriota bacterium]|nr:metal ABC transporter permease [Cyanobacteriota bacterium]